jgi:hypothetical protein
VSVADKVAIEDRSTIKTSLSINGHAEPERAADANVLCESIWHGLTRLMERRKQLSVEELSAREHRYLWEVRLATLMAKCPTNF